VLKKRGTFLGKLGSKYWYVAVCEKEYGMGKIRKEKRKRGEKEKGRRKKKREVMNKF